MRKTELGRRFTDYLNRLIEINEREFGIGRLDLSTFEKIAKRIN